MSHLPIVDIGRLKSTVTLDAIAGANATAGNVDMNSNKIVNVTDGTAASDAATFGQLTAVTDGLSYKEQVVVATAAALAAYTRTANNITADANGAIGNIDGVAVAVNDRILLKDGAANADNGIWVVSVLGDAGTAFELDRATDADTAAEIDDGATVWAQQGTANGDKRFTQTETVATLNTDANLWVVTGAQASSSVIGDNTDVTDSSRVDGSLFRFEATGSQWEATTGSNLLLTDAGQLQVPTTGGSAGVVIGGDATLTRLNAGELTLGTDVVVSNDFAVTNDASVIGSFETNAVVRENVSVNNAASPYAVASTDHVILADSSGGAVTVQPPAAASSAGRELIIKDAGGAAGTSTITVDPNGAETIDGAATYPIDENYHGIRIICDGSEWFIL